MAVSSTSLREKGDMLLSGATDDQEKEPRGWRGASLYPRGLAGSRPLVSRKGLSGPAGPAGQKGRGMSPPTVSNLLLSTMIMVTPWPRASYLQKING